MQILLGLLFLSFLVLLHELGHFIAAKLLKIPVIRFSIGFGKPIFSKKIGETEYTIAPFLLGGFVQMEGEQPNQERDENGFLSRPIWQRALVAIAGPAVNLITAFIFLFIMYIHGVPTPTYSDSLTIGTVSDSSSLRGEFFSGDSIISINNKKMKSWDDIEATLSDLSGTYTVDLYRNGKDTTISVTVTKPKPDQIMNFSLGLFPTIKPVVGSVVDSSPAYKSGLKKGDTIVAISGTKIKYWGNISNLVKKAIENSDDSLIILEYKRGETVNTCQLKPIFDSTSNRYVIGITALVELDIKKYGFRDAIIKAKDKYISYLQSIFVMLKRLFTGQISPKYLSGPVSIVMISGLAVQAGVAAALNLLALISINLGALNLMPLVITDGGILFFLIIEAITGKKVPEEVQEKLSLFFIVLFLLLFVYVTFSDIKLIPSLLGK